MREIWNNEVAEYHGEFVDFEPTWSWPKPVQPGGPPVLLGAKSRWVPGRVAEYCDGWFSNRIAERSCADDWNPCRRWPPKLVASGST